MSKVLEHPRAAGRASEGGPTSVLLVDDQAVIRESLRTLLGQCADIAVVGEAGNGRDAVAMTVRLDPDVVLMDIGMPIMNGIEATRRIRALAPRSRILILSAHTDDDYVRGVMAMGAVGYILKHSSLAGLAGSIRRTGRGGTVISALVRKRHARLPRRGRLPG